MVKVQTPREGSITPRGEAPAVSWPLSVPSVPYPIWSSVLVDHRGGRHPVRWTLVERTGRGSAGGVTPLSNTRPPARAAPLWFVGAGRGMHWCVVVTAAHRSDHVQPIHPPHRPGARPCTLEPGSSPARLPLGAVVNALLLYLINRDPGWQAVPFLTDATTEVLGLVNASIAVSLVANLVYVAWDPVWLKALGDLVTISVGVAALVRIWQVWPIDFPAGSPWDVLARVAVGVGHRRRSRRHRRLDRALHQDHGGLAEARLLTGAPVPDVTWRRPGTVSGSPSSPVGRHPWHSTRRRA